jgi:hypothetical protein
MIALFIINFSSTASHVGRPFGIGGDGHGNGVQQE